MKAIFVIWGFAFFVASAGLQAQTIPGDANRNVQAMVVKEGTGQTQLQFWKNRVTQNNKDATAWVQYYQWAERDQSLTGLKKQNFLETIYQSANSEITGSWGKYLIQYLHSGMIDTTALRTAVSLSEDDKLVLPYAIQAAILYDNPKDQKIWGEKLNQIAPFSVAMFRYHRDCLFSAAENATIYAKGLNDLVPLAILQQVYGIRTDIQLKYYSHSVESDYNTYLCLSMGKNILLQYPTAQYTGLLVKLKSNTGEKELEQNIDKIFEKQDLPLSQLTDEEKLIYRNYLPSLLLLYKKYEHTHEAKKDRYLSIISKIGEATESMPSIQTLLGNE